MKKVIYKLLSVSLLFAMISTTFSPVFAEEQLMINGDSYGEYEGNPDYYSPEQAQIREELAKKIASQITPYAASKTLAITGTEQENGYYCGVASVQIILKYKTGVNYSQSELATSMGTTSSSGTSRGSIVTELNKKIGAGTYADVSTSSIDLESGTQYSINNNCPLVYNVMPTYLPGYEGYSSSGHYIVGYGYKFGTESSVIYWDTFRTTKGSYGSHTVSFSTMKTAIDAKNGHYIMKAQ